MRRIGLARRQHGHFLRQPVCAVFPFQLLLQVQIDVDQMRHVRQRIFELPVRQRPTAPVGEARRLVEPLAGDLLDQLVVGDAVAEAAHHGRHLRVEDRVRNQVAEVVDDLDVLARGMEDLGDRLVGHQVEERREIDARRQRVDQRRHARRGHLDQAEFGPERGLADELGVDGDEFGIAKCGEGGFEVFLACNQVHRFSLEPSGGDGNAAVDQFTAVEAVHSLGVSGRCTARFPFWPTRRAKIGEVRSNAANRPRSSTGTPGRTRMR